MKIIKKPKRIAKLDTKIRIVKRRFPKGMFYVIEQFDENYKEWSTPDYGPGSSGWIFKTKRKAMRFWNDIQKLSNSKMKRKYGKEGRWA